MQTTTPTTYRLDCERHDRPVLQYRRRPVKDGVQSSAYFHRETFRRVFPVRESARAKPAIWTPPAVVRSGPKRLTINCAAIRTFWRDC